MLIRVAVILLLVFSYSLNSLGQSGWNFDKPTKFEIQDTNYFNRNEIERFEISDSSGQIVNLQFDTLGQLILLLVDKQKDLIYYDSLGNKTLQVRLTLNENLEPIVIDSMFEITGIEDTAVFVTKTTKKGVLLNSTNADLNAKYLKVKVRHPKSQKKVKLLKKKLKTNYNDTVWYNTRLITSTTVKLADTIKTDTAIFQKGEAFKLPSFMQSKDTLIIVDSLNERMYHKRVFFSANGNIDRFFFTDEPQRDFLIRYYYRRDE